MTTKAERLLRGSPRVLGLLMSIFVSLFALDAFSHGRNVAAALPDFARHLAPGLFLLAVVAASWRRPWLGGTVFTVLAIVYTTMTGGRADWVLVIAMPLLLVGMLFLWSWRHQRVARHQGR